MNGNSTYSPLRNTPGTNVNLATETRNPDRPICPETPPKLCEYMFLIL